MPNLSRTNKHDINELWNAYNLLSTWEKWLFPSAIKEALTAFQNTTDEVASTWLFYNAFLNNNGWFQRWYFPFLWIYSESVLIKALEKSNLIAFSDEEISRRYFRAIVLHEEPGTVVSAYKLLETEPETQVNFEAVAACKYPITAATALIKLSRTVKLTNDIRKSVVLHQLSQSAARGIAFLQKESLLTQENLIAIVGNKSPLEAAELLCTLHHFGLLSGKEADKYRSIIRTHDAPSLLSDSLKKSNHYSWDEKTAETNFNAIVIAIEKYKNPRYILNVLDQLDTLIPKNTQPIRNAVVRHECPSELLKALVQLNDTGLLTGPDEQTHVTLLEKHKNPKSAAYALQILTRENLLSNTNVSQHCQFILKHHDPKSIAESLDALNKAAILNEEGNATAYFDLIESYPNITHRLNTYLGNLKAAHILNHRNFHILLNHPHNNFDALSALQNANLLTQENFNQLILHCDILCSDSLMIKNCWESIDNSYQLTKFHFDEMIVICQTKARITESACEDLINYVNQAILGLTDVLLI